MKINRIKLQNFYSFQDLEFSFDEYETGILFLRGVNLDSPGSNGAGKSAFIEAICFGLFGKTIRKGTESSIVNYKAKKRCEVELLVNGNVVIRRGKIPTFLEVTIDGEECTKTGVKETQKFLEAYLNIDYKTFLSSMVFGQNNSLEFIGSSPEEKRTILKTFLDVEELFSYRENVKKYKSKSLQEIKVIDKLLEEHQESLLEAITEKDYLTHIQSSIVSELSQEKRNFLDKNSIHDVLKLEANLRVAMDEMNYLDKQKRDLEGLIFFIKRKLRKDSCSECGAYIEIDQDKLNQELKETKEQYEKCKEAFQIAKEMMLHVGKQILIKSDEYKEYEGYFENKGIIPILKKEIEKYKDLAHKNKKDHKIHTKEYEIMRFWEAAFSEQGIVRFLIRNILDFFNSKCNYYLTFLSNGEYVIKFEENLDETIKVNGSEVHYISLSGGERKRVDLAVILAMNDLLVLTGKQSANLIFFDEIADHLDEKGISNLYNLLQELKKEKLIFIISHSDQLKELLISEKSIYVVKEKGNSTLKMEQYA